jgi:serine/threonine-protein kinase
MASDGIFTKYELIRRIGTGGMGEIFLARQKGVAGSERTVIIKMILAHLAGDPEFVDRFTDESRLAASLSHGNIVQIFESGCFEGRFFMVMEYVDGLDLKALLQKTDGRRQTATWTPFYVHVLSEIAKALAFAHQKKDESGRPLRIVHRDVSPSNILISREGLVKLTDFGVAKATRRTSVSLPGRLHGKVNYMAPEQVRGGECDHRSDIFSLGVVGYEMLTGKRPFESDSDVAVLENIRTMNFVPLGVAAPEAPSGLCTIISKCLETDAGQRWQSAEDLSAALMTFAHNNGLSLLSKDIAGLLVEDFEEATPLTGPGISIDDAINGLLRTPSAGSQIPGGLTAGAERTRTISKEVPTPGSPTAQADVAAGKSARRRTFRSGALAGIAFAVLAVAALTVAGINVGGFLSNGLTDAGIADEVTEVTANSTDAGRVRSDEKGPATDSETGDERRSSDGVSATGDQGSAARDNPDKTAKPTTEPRIVTIRSNPPGASILIDGRDAGTTPQKLEVKAGDKIRMTLHKDGFADTTAIIDQRSPATVTVDLPPPDGRVVFRFFPADSVVLIDGKSIKTDGNLVELDMKPGEHLLVLSSNKGDNKKTRSFTIEPGKTVALGTIELDQVQ